MKVAQGKQWPELRASSLVQKGGGRARNPTAVKQAILGNRLLGRVLGHFTIATPYILAHRFQQLMVNIALSSTGFIQFHCDHRPAIYIFSHISNYCPICRTHRRLQRSSYWRNTGWRWRERGIDDGWLMTLHHSC